MYFDKFLVRFVDPVFDRWTSIGVSHSLSVVFFARTMYTGTRENTSTGGTSAVGDPLEDGCSTEGSTPALTPPRRSIINRNDGGQHEDFYKVVVENLAEIDKTTFIRTLKDEFWNFPNSIGWNMNHIHPYGCNCHRKINKNYDDNANYGVKDGVSRGENMSQDCHTSQEHALYHGDGDASRRFSAIPSDSINGNFLGAINTSLNILGLHYMDRDLVRTGNSIVMVSAGVGIFKVYYGD